MMTPEELLDRAEKLTIMYLEEEAVYEGGSASVLCEIAQARIALEKRGEIGKLVDVLKTLAPIHGGVAPGEAVEGFVEPRSVARLQGQGSKFIVGGRADGTINVRLMVQDLTKTEALTLAAYIVAIADWRVEFEDLLMQVKQS
jgi:hypothetical protein